jgi:DnaJ-class molecular chaperone
MVYPVTLKYAFYLLKQGHFFIPSLNTKLTFDSRSMAGDAVCFRGKGFPGMFGGSAGDYIVSFKLTHHTPFHIENGDLHMQLKVSRQIWEKGGEVYFDAPTGLFKVQITPRMNINSTLRFKNKGLPADKHQKGGHLFAKLVLEG